MLHYAAVFIGLVVVAAVIAVSAVVAGAPGAANALAVLFLVGAGIALGTGRSSV